MKRSLYHTYQMNLGTSCLLNRTIPKNLSTKRGALQSPLFEAAHTFPHGPLGVRISMHLRASGEVRLLCSVHAVPRGPAVSRADDAEFPIG